jgi:hypothetical protein
MCEAKMLNDEDRIHDADGAKIIQVIKDDIEQEGELYRLLRGKMFGFMCRKVRQGAFSKVRP